jgi:predicted unusual protein kinase regulating ubiquinone biosynthesis (AarF/ABC1/UbiB family)
VHRATLADGRVVAVKLRYPDALQRIGEDFKRLRAVLPVLHGVVPGVAWGRVLQGWRRLYEIECDYQEEVARTERLRAALLAAGVEGIAIPEVITTYCTSEAIVMEFCPGVSFETFVANSSQAERDRAGLALARGVFRLMDAGHFSYDLHADNFHFDGEVLHWLDHGGAVTAEAHAGLPEFIRCLLAGDQSGFAERLAPFATKKTDAVAMMRLFRSVLAPFLRDEPFAFTPAFAQSVLKDLFRSLRRGQLTIPVDSDMVGLRFFLSFYDLLGRLGATAAWRQVLD